MKAKELIAKLQECIKVSEQVPGRKEDEVFVVSEDGKSISPLAEAYSDDNPFAHAGVLLKSQATVDRHRPKVALQNAAFALCELIEKLPAGTPQTDASIAASNLRTQIDQFIDRLP